MPTRTCDYNHRTMFRMTPYAAKAQGPAQARPQGATWTIHRRLCPNRKLGQYIEDFTPGGKHGQYIENCTGEVVQTIESRN